MFGAKSLVFLCLIFASALAALGEDGDPCCGHSECQSGLKCFMMYPDEYGQGQCGVSVVQSASVIDGGSRGQETSLASSVYTTQQKCGKAQDSNLQCSLDGETCQSVKDCCISTSKFVQVTCCRAGKCNSGDSCIY